MKRLRRRGFTLIELLVVIGIIAVLVAIMLPAVQHAREAARKMTCLANVRDLALATQNYASTTGGGGGESLPPAELADGWATWCVLLLPYMEQQAAYDLWDAPTTSFEQVEFMKVDPQPPNLLCPSRPHFETHSGWFFIGHGLVFGSTGQTHYAALRGTDRGKQDGSFRVAFRNPGTTWYPPISLLAGVKIGPWKSQVSLAHSMAATASNRLWFSEKASALPHQETGAFDGSNQNGYCRIAGDEFPIVQDHEIAITQHILRLGSFHAGVVSSSFADGSAKRIPKDIDATVLENMVDIDSYEIIEPF